jgi:hypothetical protein
LTHILLLKDMLVKTRIESVAVTALVFEAAAILENLNLTRNRFCVSRRGWRKDMVAGKTE